MDWSVGTDLRNLARGFVRKLEVAAGACGQRAHQSRRHVLEEIEVCRWWSDRCLQSLVLLEKARRGYHGTSQF